MDPPLATPSARQHGEHEDEALLERVRQRLKGERGTAPDLVHVAIAVACARDGSLMVGSVCKQRTPPVKPGKAQNNIRAYVKRIREDDLLVSCAISLPAMDADTADAERRAKKARQRHNQREHQADVRYVLDSIIERIERSAEREAREHQRELMTGQRLDPWRCPAGCAPNSLDCGRVQFRKQCIPSAADIGGARRELWEAANCTQQGGFRDSRGRRYGSFMQQRLRDEEMEAQRDQMPSFEVCGTELLELQEMFLVWWDGRCSPGAWLRHWLQHNEHYPCAMSPEYRGEPTVQPPSADTLAACMYRACTGCARCCCADCFGPDLRPVGPAACARRGCSGCCYCRRSDPLPVYLQMRTFTWSLGGDAGPWLSIDELRRNLTALASRSCDNALPAYLLSRRGPGPVGDGRVVCVAGDVRKHVPAAELDEWAERLERRGVLLLILRSTSRACELDGAEQASMRAHVANVQTLRDQAKSEWAPLQREACQWQKQVEWEALTRHSCGERLREPGVRSAFRVGDVVYSAPSNHKMQHGVAVITSVGRRTDAESNIRLPTGELSLLVWDPTCRGFDGRVLRTDVGGDCDWTLLPPCCGRGAACPQLALTLPEERQWPNGHELDICDIQPIPEALLALVQPTVSSQKLTEQLQPFKRLLGSLMPPPPPPPPPLPAPPPQPPAASPAASPAAASPTAASLVAASPASSADSALPSWCTNLSDALEAKVATEVEALMSDYEQRTCSYTKADAEAMLRQLHARRAGYGPQPPRGWLLEKPYNLTESEWSRKVSEKAEREWTERVAQGVLTFARLQGAAAELWLADLKAQ